MIATRQNDALKWDIATVLGLGKPHRVVRIHWECGINESTRAFVSAEAGLNDDADDYSFEAGIRFRFQSIFPWGNSDRS